MVFKKDGHRASSRRQFRQSELSGQDAAGALWEALITHAGNLEINPVAAAKARCVIDDVLAEQEQSR
jgi:hypothetical protein